MKLKIRSDGLRFELGGGAKAGVGSGRGGGATPWSDGAGRKTDRGRRRDRKHVTAREACQVDQKTVSRLSDNVVITPQLKPDWLISAHSE